MKVELVPNKGPVTMGVQLATLLAEASCADIASAFVTPAGLAILDRALATASKAHRRLSIRLLFGLYQRFTPPEAIRKMIAMQRRYPSRFLARVARNTRFHWKLYAFRREGYRRFFVGSANLTEDGLTASGELTLKLTVQRSHPLSKNLDAQFEALWRTQSFPIGKDFLKKYAALVRPPTTRGGDAEERRILSMLEPPSRTRGPVAPRDDRIRLVYLDELLSDQTIETIRAQTDWDRNGWDYFSLSYKSQYEPTIAADTYLVVDAYTDAANLRLSLRRRADTAILDTTDGRYFVAHSRLGASWTREYSALSPALKKVGLSAKAIRSDKYLTKSQVKVVRKLLRADAAA